MQGSLLRPLNRLNEVDPDLYRSAVEKYSNHPSRLEIPSRKIPLLDCRWGDVLQFSPIHPHLIANAMTEAGMMVPNWFFFEIPIKMVRDLPAVMYYGMEETPRYQTIDWETYQELEAVPKATAKWYEQLAHRHRTGAVFNGIPHVMIHGHVNTSDCSTVSMQELSP